MIDPILNGTSKLGHKPTVAGGYLENRWLDFGRWPLRDRLHLLAFEAELVGLPRPLISALWEAIDCPRGSVGCRRPTATSRRRATI